MSERSVWSKWNTIAALRLIETLNASPWYPELDSGSGTYPGGYAYTSLKFLISGSRNLISLIDYSSVPISQYNYDYVYIPNDNYFMVNEQQDYYVYKSKSAELDWSNDGASNVWDISLVSGTIEKYDGNGKEKGTTSYGNISASASDSYPSNGVNGNYWYIKLGTDVIDPISVSYDTPHGGELLDIIVTPSASIQYGGTISYKYETSTDGGVTWTTVNASTTATTVSVLVPAGVQTFQARVTASDNMGFTSTTAVAGENIAVINNVAPVITCMVLDLGKLAAAFSVDYNVSDEDEDQMTVTEAVDGVKIRDFSIPTGGGTH